MDCCFPHHPYSANYLGYIGVSMKVKKESTGLEIENYYNGLTDFFNNLNKRQMVDRLLSIKGLKGIDKKTGTITNKDEFLASVRDMMNNEKDFTSLCIGYLNTIEIVSPGSILWWRDNHSLWNKAGFPDLIVWERETWERMNNMGKVYETYAIVKTHLIELKVKGRKLSKAQRKFRDFFKTDDPKSLIQYYKVDTFEEFTSIFRDYGIEIS